MKRIHDLDEWRDYADQQRRNGRTLGLVTTMGALHEGHASLFEAAKIRGDLVLATIFVNPRQFGDERDLARYPRTPELDAKIAEEHGVECLVEPSLEQMWPQYPGPTLTTVSVRGLGDVLEGEGRPGHFDGVASVVAKLFALNGPSRAYFGEKDFQQIVVIRQMVHDLALPVDVIACPIVRDHDGLALSSRNVLLSESARRDALGLSRALRAVQSAPMTASQMRVRMRSVMEESGVQVSYADVVDPVTLVASGDDERGPRRALVAGVVGGVRLIDNAPVEISPRDA